MTVDATYPAGVVQRRQNGSLCVVSGTTITIESGGTLRVESGGTLAYAAGAIPLMAVESIASSATPFANSGLTIFGTTANGASYNLAQMTQIGQSKFLAKTVHGATTVTETVLCTGATILNATTAATSVITFANRGWVHLIAATTNQWVIVSTNATKAEVSYS